MHGFVRRRKSISTIAKSQNQNRKKTSAVDAYAQPQSPALAPVHRSTHTHQQLLATLCGALCCALLCSVNTETGNANTGGKRKLLSGNPRVRKSLRFYLAAGWWSGVMLTTHHALSWGLAAERPNTMATLRRTMGMGGTARGGGGLQTLRKLFYKTSTSSVALSRVLASPTLEKKKRRRNPSKCPLYFRVKRDEKTTVDFARWCKRHVFFFAASGGSGCHTPACAPCR